MPLNKMSPLSEALGCHFKKEIIVIIIIITMEIIIIIMEIEIAIMPLSHNCFED